MQLTSHLAAGLFLQPNSFMTVPDGACEVAHNVTIARDQLVTARRGWKSLPTELLNARGIFSFGAYLLGALSSSVVAIQEDGASSILSGITPSFSGSARMAQLKGNAYLNDDDGVIKVQSVSTAVERAGMPRGLDISTVVSAASDGFLLPDHSVVYAYLVGKTDIHGNKVIGAPSMKVSVANTGSAQVTWAYVSSTSIKITATHSFTVTSPATQVVLYGLSNSGTANLVTMPDYTEAVITAVTGTTDFTISIPGIVIPEGASGTIKYGQYKQVALTITLPTGLSTNHIVQIFRSKTVTAGISLGALPTQELALLDESNLTSGEVSGLSKSFTDKVPDSLLGAELYTNENGGEGAAQANAQPPQCADLAEFKQCLFMANTVGQETLSIQMNLQSQSITAASTLVIAGQTYTASASTEAASQFRVYTESGDGASISETIALTAQSVCRVINKNASSTVYAYYTSGVDDLPGQISIVSKTFGAASFSVHSTSATVRAAFSPNLPSTAGVTNSELSTQPNAIYYSKQNEPEAVPFTNYFLVGSKSTVIQRVLPLRDSLIILLNDGVYRITGSSPSSFSVSPIDLTVKCLAPDSAAVLNNRVFCLTQQGVVSITDTFVEVKSRNIESPLLVTVLKNAVTNARAIGYESERSYFLCTVAPNADTDAVNTLTYVYNAVTDTWVTSDRLFRCGTIHTANGKMYSVNLDATLVVERKSLDRSDYADDEFAVTTIDAVQTLSTTLQVTTDEPDTKILAGDVLRFGDVFNNVVSSSQAPGGVWTVILEKKASFSALQHGVLLKAFTSVLRGVPFTGGDVSRTKAISEFQAHFRTDSCSKMGIKFQTNFGGSSTVAWTRPALGGWGTLPWGTFAWGESGSSTLGFLTTPATPVRVWVPLVASRCSWIQVELTHSTACEAWDLQALSWSATIGGNSLLR